MSDAVRAMAALTGVAVRILRRVPGPVFWNEMRYAFLRGRPTGWVLGGIGAACGSAFLIGAAAWFRNASVEGDPPGRRLFFVVSLLLLGVVAAAGPAYSAGAFISEKNRRTFDLLLSSGLRSWDLVLGKTASAFVRTLACAAAGLPCLLAAQALGGLGPWEIPKHLVFFASWAAMGCSLGAALSMFYRSYALALLSAYLVFVPVLMATMWAALMAYLIFKMGLGLPYPGFWAISSVVNVALSAVFLSGSLLLFGPLAKWDY